MNTGEHGKKNIGLPDPYSSVFIRGLFSFFATGLLEIETKNPMRKCCAMTLLLFVLAGCSSPGVLVSRQVEETPPKMGRVQVAGTYGLFIAGDAQDLYELPLHVDDPIGFEWGDEGLVKWIYAVGGNSRNRLDVTKTYEWRRLP